MLRVISKGDAIMDNLLVMHTQVPVMSITYQAILNGFNCWWSIWLSRYSGLCHPLCHPSPECMSSYNPNTYFCLLCSVQMKCADQLLQCEYEQKDLHQETEMEGKDTRQGRNGERWSRRSEYPASTATSEFDRARAELLSKGVYPIPLSYSNSCHPRNTEASLKGSLVIHGRGVAH